MGLFGCKHMRQMEMWRGVRRFQVQDQGAVFDLKKWAGFGKNWFFGSDWRIKRIRACGCRASSRTVSVKYALAGITVIQE